MDWYPACIHIYPIIIVAKWILFYNFQKVYYYNLIYQFINTCPH